MVRIAAVFVWACLSGLCFGQAPATLGEARSVDIRADWVQWSPAGNCLAYSRDIDAGGRLDLGGKLESGVGIGLFKVGDREGTLLVRLKRTDVWNLQWFEGQEAAILTVQSAEAAGKRLTVYLLTPKPGLATKIFEETAELNEALGIDVELSPLLEHGVFTVHKAGRDYRLILSPGGTSLVRSADLEEAAQEGLIGPKWASSGTAFYLDRKAADAIQARGLPEPSTPRDQLLKAIMAAESAPPTVSSTSTSAGSAEEGRTILVGRDSLVQSLKDQLTPAPSEGEPGLELMPTVGVLRPVRSPGPWRAAKKVRYDLVMHLQAATVSSAPLEGRAQSLWLVSGDLRSSVLVAPSSERSWLSPDWGAIAYTVNGVLFVRTLNSVRAAKITVSH